MSAPGPAPEVFAGPLGEQLRRRLEQAIAEAERTLGLDPGETVGPERLPALIAAIAERLDAPARERAVSEHESSLRRLRERYEARFEALARVRAAVADLREVTSPGAMLARAPAALCGCSTLRRAILSVVRNGTMLAESVHVAGDAAGARALAEQLRSSPVRLEHPLIETELLRRRRATLVNDAHVHARVHRHTAELMGWRSYVAAPLLAGQQVIGVLHADCGRGRSLDVLHRDVLWEFATGLSQAYESSALRRALRQEREQMRWFLDWVGARASALTDTPVALAPLPAAVLPPPEPLGAPGIPEGRDDRVVFAGLLTRRELDVLRLIADGHSNRSIAAALVVSEATVKFHVNSILRKLHVANRAEAVARYLTLLGMSPP